MVQEGIKDNTNQGFIKTLTTLFSTLKWLENAEKSEKITGNYEEKLSQEIMRRNYHRKL